MSKDISDELDDLERPITLLGMDGKEHTYSVFDKQALLNLIEREKKAEARHCLQPLPIHKTMRSSRNSNTARSLGVKRYFNKVVKDRLSNRLAQLRGKDESSK